MDKQLTTTPHCQICGTREQLLRCAKCKTIYYCSSAHQHMDWPNHKQECRLLARQKNNNKIQQLQQAVAATTLDASGATVSGNTTIAGAQTTIPAEVSKWCEMIENVVDHKPLSYILDTYMNDKNEAMIDDSIGNSNTNDNHPTLNIIPQHLSEQPLQNQQQLHQQQQSQMPYYINNQNGQSEKSSSYQIGLADENFIGNFIGNERRYEDLCRNIINDMNQYGLSVVDDFLGMEKGLQILNEVHRMYAAGVFKDGQLVNNKKTEKDLRTIRGDKIAWVKGLEPGCSNVGYLINQIDAVIYRANTMKNNGKLGDYNIRERTKAMVACYPGSGSHYVMHVDNPHKDGRVITAIYYLNVNWDTIRSGGVLRILPTAGNAVAEIEPKFDRLIFFWSDIRNPHEVQPAHRTRYAITVWYFDANEREAALNRCKHQNETNTAAPTTTTTATVLTKLNANANPNITPPVAESSTTQTKTDAINLDAEPTTTTNANSSTTPISQSEICT